MTYIPNALRNGLESVCRAFHLHFGLDRSQRQGPLESSPETLGEILATPPAAGSPHDIDHVSSLTPHTHTHTPSTLPHVLLDNGSDAPRPSAADRPAPYRRNTEAVAGVAGGPREVSATSVNFISRNPVSSRRRNSRSHHAFPATEHRPDEQRPQQRRREGPNPPANTGNVALAGRGEMTMLRGQGSRLRCVDRSPSR